MWVSLFSVARTREGLGFSQMIRVHGRAMQRRKETGSICSQAVQKSRSWKISGESTVLATRGPVTGSVPQICCSFFGFSPFLSLSFQLCFLLLPTPLPHLASLINDFFSLSLKSNLVNWRIHVLVSHAFRVPLLGRDLAWGHVRDWLALS